MLGVADSNLAYVLQDVFLEEFESEGVYSEDDNSVTVTYQDRFPSTFSDREVAEAALEAVQRVDGSEKLTVAVTVYSLYAAPFTTHIFEATSVKSG